MVQQHISNDRMCYFPGVLIWVRRSDLPYHAKCRYLYHVTETPKHYSPRNFVFKTAKHFFLKKNCSSIRGYVQYGGNRKEQRSRLLGNETSPKITRDSYQHLKPWEFNRLGPSFKFPMEIFLLQRNEKKTNE